MEQIYTIPVNEAFEKCADEGGCPFCNLFDMLNSNEIELILGASMMEPDTREKTNKKGFCARHMKTMLQASKKLPLALIFESHLAEIKANIPSPGVLPPAMGALALKKLDGINSSCYICDRVEYNFSRMLDTAAYLWESDDDFKRKARGCSGYCLVHFEEYLKSAKARMKAKSFGEFYREIYKTELSYLEGVSEKVSRFAKSFDYRYAGEPLGDAKAAVEDAVSLVFGSDIK